MIFQPGVPKGLALSVYLGAPDMCNQTMEHGIMVRVRKIYPGQFRIEICLSNNIDVMTTIELFNSHNKHRVAISQSKQLICKQLAFSS